MLLSNYEYLCHLNDAAGRSCADLAQYPVMPWVLQDYTSHTLDLADPAVYRDLSKPVGALDASRLALFRERSPTGDAFMYGTHYSAPAFVAYFLVRQRPALETALARRPLHLLPQ
uniref:BEACH domain-containing protein n=1 Tax=Emiliania huxleyi (strain CCMP1516) TaxID=280463 RepID=A0A0D3L1A1_EMIH1